MHTYSFKKMVNNIGFYCKIDFTFKLSDGDGYEISFLKKSKWDNAIRFGVEYYSDQLERMSKQKKITIEIIDIDTMIVDTTQIVVFYTIVKSLEKEIGIEVKKIALSNEGIFMISK